MFIGLRQLDNDIDMDELERELNELEVVKSGIFISEYKHYPGSMYKTIVVHFFGREMAGTVVL